MSRATVDGHETFFGTGGVEQVGDGPCVVMIHGAGCDHTVWALQARRLAQRGCRVVAVDLPAHGMSDGDPITSIDGFAEWLDSVFTTLAIDGAVSLIGHSMGACIATSYTAKYHGKVANLALLGAGDAMPVNPALLDDTLSHPERARAFIAAFGHGRATHFGQAATPGIWNIGATLALLERCDPATLHADFAACNEWTAAGTAEEIGCRSLIIAGSADRMTPPRSARALDARLSNARIETIAGAGHLLLSETPDEVSRLLVDFVTDG